MSDRIKNPAAVALGRLGGAVKSDAKRAASRRNGKSPKVNFKPRKPPVDVAPKVTA